MLTSVEHVLHIQWRTSYDNVDHKLMKTKMFEKKN